MEAEKWAVWEESRLRGERLVSIHSTRDKAESRQERLQRTDIDGTDYFVSTVLSEKENYSDITLNPDGSHDSTICACQICSAYRSTRY